MARPGRLRTASGPARTVVAEASYVEPSSGAVWTESWETCPLDALGTDSWAWVVSTSSLSGTPTSSVLQGLSLETWRGSLSPTCREHATQGDMLPVRRDVDTLWTPIWGGSVDKSAPESPHRPPRSEERRVGKEWVNTSRFRW